jgi:epoxyqueuosine reductase
MTGTVKDRSTAAEKVSLRRQIGHRSEAAVGRLLAPALHLDRLGWMRFMPTIPPLHSIKRVRHAWHDRRGWTPPAGLATTAGIWRDRAAEKRAYAENPLHDFTIIHAASNDDALEHGWRYILPTGGRLVRATRRMRTVGAQTPTKAPAQLSPEQLKVTIRAEADRIGINGIGFAAFDEKYSFAEHVAQHVHPTVIVCAVEQDFEATQTAPSIRSERAAFHTYGEMIAAITELAEAIQRLGYAARPQPVGAEMVTIHYGVESGLGQLGLNGQLLTPDVGSRCRLGIVTTDAPVALDVPVDYGIHAICDSCQACVRRCPVGAIPAKRADYRGIIKAKIKTERCFPVVAREHGCAICMKVCPIQRYGLEAVTEHFEQNGTVLGVGSDELEGFDWPRDGRRYGPGKKPRVNSELVNPPGWVYDASASERADAAGPSAKLS